MAVLLRIGGNFSHLRAKPAHLVGHLPAAQYTITGPDGRPEPVMRYYGPTLGIRQGKPDRHYRVLSTEEMYRLFAAIPDTVQGLRDRAIFLLYFWTARRREEIAHVTG